MSTWLITVPTWSDHYRNIFLERAGPALKVALQNLATWAKQDLKSYVRLVIHTDAPGFADALFEGFTVQYVHIRPDATYTTLQYSHRDAVNMAAEGERVGLLNADLVVSGNLFMHCEEMILRGKKAIVLLGIRTLLGPEKPPINAKPRDLLNWAWEHRHDVIQELIWGRGGSGLPTNLFFVNEATGSVVARGFHLHPVAVIKEQNLSFKSTIDGDMLDHLKYSDIHLVTDPDDMAIVSETEAGKHFGVGQAMTVQQVVSVMKTRASALHRWQFTQRIIVRGDGSGINDTPVAVEILQHLGTDTSFLR